MGIDKFNKNIKQEYPTAFKIKWLESYDYVYIDLNFALHYSTHGVKNINELYSRLFKFIENILLEVCPKKKIYFATDGSAPLAKLLLQRKRRSDMSKMIDTHDVSGLMFTPGTKFMMSLENEMQLFIKYLSYIFNVEIEFLNLNYDEAELKIKKQIMDNINDDMTMSLTHLFVSNDADVVLMLTTLENTKNVFIYDKKSNHVLSVYKLLDLHTEKVGLTENYGLDFTALNLMLGNDYLPKVNYIDFDKLWIAYKKLSFRNSEGLIVKNGKNITINISFFLKLMNILIYEMKPTYLNKPTHQELTSPMYKNYFDGFAWCLSTYIDGICTNYNYMYGYETKPHPLGLMYNIKFLNAYDYSLSSSPILPSLYSILLLPKSAKHLINPMYHKFIDQEKSLYIEECCEKCKSFNKKIKELKLKFGELETEELLETDDETKKNLPKRNKELFTLSKLFSLHKKQHSVLNLDDIEEIKQKFNLINIMKIKNN